MKVLKYLLICLVAIFFLAPLFFLAPAWFTPSDKAWSFFIEEELTPTFFSTVIFTLGTTLLSTILGISLSYMIAFYNFPFRNYFEWALLLPLAVPAYILGFVYLGLFEINGVLYSLFPSFVSRLPTIKTMEGAIVFKSLTLYPYIYLLCKNAFLTQSSRLVESAKILGCKPFTVFRKVLLPLAWPWIAGGMTLVFMEAMADYGMVKIFNVETFTTIVFSKWAGEQSFLAAARIAFLLVLFLFVFFVLEKILRGNAKYHQGVKEGMSRPLLLPLTGWKSVFFTGYLYSLFFLSVVLPIGLLAYWAILQLNKNGWQEWAHFLPFALHTCFLSLVAGLICTFISFLLCLYHRYQKNQFSSVLLKFTTLGYALPGTLIGIGVFAFLNYIAQFSTTLLFLKSSLFALYLGYIFRFNAVSLQTIDSSYQRISPSIDEVGRTFGKGVIPFVAKVHLPMLKMGLFSSVILVFVDVMKELPFTLIMRPYGWDTLAIKIFNYTTEGEWGMAAFPSILLILVGVVPILLLTKISKTKLKGEYE